MFNFLKPKQTIIPVNCVFNCGKEKCPKWIVMTKEVTKEDGKTEMMPIGKCADVWNVIILSELKGVIRDAIKKSNIVIPK